MAESILSKFDEELNKNTEGVNKSEAGDTKETEIEQKDNEKEVDGKEMEDKTNKKDAKEAGDKATVNKNEEVEPTLTADDVKEIVKSVLTETFKEQNDLLSKSVSPLATSEQVDKTIGVFAKAYGLMQDLSKNLEKNINKSVEDSLKSASEKLDKSVKSLQEASQEGTTVTDGIVSKSTETPKDEKSVEYVAKSTSETINDEGKENPVEKSEEEVEKNTINRLDLLDRYNTRMKEDISKGVYATSPAKIQVIKSIGSALAFNRLSSEDELEFAKSYADGGKVTLE